MTVKQTLLVALEAFLFVVAFLAITVIVSAIGG
jgi:hypothetical protein